MDSECQALRLLQRHRVILLSRSLCSQAHDSILTPFASPFWHLRKELLYSRPAFAARYPVTMQVSRNPASCRLRDTGFSHYGEQVLVHQFVQLSSYLSTSVSIGDRSKCLRERSKHHMRLEAIVSHPPILTQMLVIRQSARGGWHPCDDLQIQSQVCSSRIPRELEVLRGTFRGVLVMLTHGCVSHAGLASYNLDTSPTAVSLSHH